MNGNGKKIALMAIAVVAIGVFALPSTVSLFSGQHVWYDIGGADNNIPCEKCHAEIFEEYMMTGAHGNLSGGAASGSPRLADARVACGACHRVNTSGWTYASGDGNGSTPGKEAHAAATIACMACHNPINESTAAAWMAPYAGGFMEMNSSTDTDLSEENQSLWQYATADNNGTYAAHNAFIIEALEDDTLQDANEACIACHTMIAVKINWTHRRSLEFDVGLDEPVTTTSGVHNWTMTNWTVNGTATATVWGNTTGAGNTTYYSDNWPGDVDGIYDE